MKKNLLIAVWFSLVTTVIFGLIYPLGITGLAQLFFRDRANGQLIEKDGKLAGSRIIGPQPEPDMIPRPAVAPIWLPRTRRCWSG
jgi:K+-transporting ATPase c subunit